MRITQRSVAKLVPYAQNARTHSEAQVAQLAASIEEFGWTNPVLVDGDGRTFSEIAQERQEAA